MVKQVLNFLNPKPGGIYVDATFGAGGHARAILENCTECSVFGVDRDPMAFEYGKAVLDLFPGKILPVVGEFGKMDKLLNRLGVDRVDGILMDIGASSFQLDEPARGFSFRSTKSGILDMRMNQSEKIPTALEVVNNFPVTEIARIIYEYGQDSDATIIARAINEARRVKRIQTTEELANIVSSVKIYSQRKSIHPVTQTFQAIRIFVNDELKQLSEGLLAAERLLKPGGRLAVIVFHSLEEKIVKNFFRYCCAGSGSGSLSDAQSNPSFHYLREKVVVPTNDEILENPRARSARLRVVERSFNKPLEPLYDRTTQSFGFPESTQYKI